MRIDFNMGMGIHEATIEIYLGDKLIQRQSMQAPQMFLKSQFMNLVEQIAKDDRPMRVKMIVPDVIWDRFEQKNKILNNYVEFNNKGGSSDN